MDDDGAPKVVASTPGDLIMWVVHLLKLSTVPHDSLLVVCSDRRGIVRGVVQAPLSHRECGWRCLASAAHDSGAQIVALLGFGSSIALVDEATRAVRDHLGLPSSRTAIVQGAWVDLDQPGVHGELAAVLHSRMAIELVWRGHRVPSADEFSRA